ncbi:hypothetical protein Psta_0698 [Pirellula staleyi DSM 6068]|uniref:Peptidase M50 n=1 Tax=Pirellula staleyi (strain ATCC 27377 / DSM 6068 / ICPB 4128) TaxID=530564 RepID=D2R5C5_PIRSD|nr:hypothetical protein Psta_0698 [Pirellula staleyi DSM 6068]
MVVSSVVGDYSSSVDRIRTQQLNEYASLVATKWILERFRFVNRFWQCLLISSLLLACWLGMQQVHELGHVLGALATGAKVERVLLHPLSISRTDLSHNPAPLVVVWCGPIVGVMAPVLLWQIAAWVRFPMTYTLRFFAAFCLVTNGLYISIGSLAQIGDCGEMLRHGSSMWQLGLFGLVTVPLGFWLWNGEGERFGLSQQARSVARSHALVMLLTAIVLLLLGLVFRG